MFPSLEEIRNFRKIIYLEDYSFPHSWYEEKEHGVGHQIYEW